MSHPAKSGVQVSTPTSSAGTPLRWSAEVLARLQGRDVLTGFENIRKLALAQLSTGVSPSDSEELWRYGTPDDMGVEDFFNAIESGKSAPVSFEFKPIAAAANVTAITPYLLFDERALAQHGELLRSLLFRQAGELPEHASSDAFHDALASLQLMVSRNVAVVRIPKGIKVVEPVEFLTRALEVEGVLAPTVVVVVESGAELTLFEDLQFGDRPLRYLPRYEFIVEGQGALTFVSAQRLHGAARMIARHRVHLYRDAQASFFHVALGGRSSRLDFDCCMHEPGARADLFSLSLADGSRHVDAHPTQMHLAPNCYSNLYYKSVATELGRTSYYGYIRVAEGAQQTDGYQKNRVMLLSPDARADSIPNLEIKANDVKCSHGSSIGQMGEEELFYLMSRGLNRAQAERLLVEAFCDELLAQVKDQGIRERLHVAIIERVLHGRSLRS